MPERPSLITPAGASPLLLAVMRLSVANKRDDVTNMNSIISGYCFCKHHLICVVFILQDRPGRRAIVRSGRGVANVFDLFRGNVVTQLKDHRQSRDYPGPRFPP